MKQNRKIRILCLTRKYPPQTGGMENFSYNLLTGLKKDPRLDVKIISLGKTQKHLVWFFPYCCLYTLFCARRFDVVFTGDAVLCLTGVLSRLVSPRTKRIINVFGLDISFRNPVYQAYLSLFYKKCSDLYISISRDTDHLLHERGIRRSVIITPGIQPSEFRRPNARQAEFRKKYGIPEGHLVLLTVGRLVKRKGAEWFIRNVMPGFAGRPVSYYVIGDGKERGAIQAAREACPAGSQIHLLGRVEQEVLDDFYQNADVFVMPNITVPGDKEGFGIVAAEAAMAGMIVLASGIEGITDAISDGNNGYLLPSGDAQAYTSRIEDILAHPAGYDARRASFAAYTREHYNWDFICDQYVKELQRLLAAGGNRK